MRAFLVVSLMFAACTKPNPDICNADSDCKDPAAPFCDVNGEYAESGHITNTCTITPATCPVERCGCTAGAGLACSADQLASCGTDGHSRVTSRCALGCSTTEIRCLAFDPSNGLGPALADSASEPDVVLPPGARIDTDVGLVQNSGGVTIAVKSVLVTQASGPSIRAFIGRSFVIDDVVVVGANALAIVSVDKITLRGRLDASANGMAKGAGGQESPAACVGTSVQSIGCGGNNQFGCNDGAGGGGNATPGGAGGGAGSTTGQRGAVTTGASLAGGCRGGGVIPISGGGGGGAVQLVSLVEVASTSSGLIDVGGGGGPASAGGGSGGIVVIESPTVRMDGPMTGIAANGGGGGGCGTNGSDATPNLISASAPQCGPQSAGYGGTVSISAGSGTLCNSSCPVLYNYGGGGGAVGRARIVTKNGTYQAIASPILAAVVTTAQLSIR
jgi:hypothetical protein